MSTRQIDAAHRRAALVANLRRRAVRECSWCVENSPIDCPGQESCTCPECRELRGDTQSNG